MATLLSRSLIAAGKQQGALFFRCSYSSLALPRRSFLKAFSPFRLRPLVSAVPAIRQLYLPAVYTTTVRRLETRPLNDVRPPYLNSDGCDFENWLVVMEEPEGDPTRDEIIDSYIKTLAQVLGSEEEAKMKIYSVSTRHYYAFGAHVSEELSHKLKELKGVQSVLLDYHLEFFFRGEPFIDGWAPPYDLKYRPRWGVDQYIERYNERNIQTLLDGCDFEHWLVVMEKLESDPTRDEIIDSYIKNLAQVVGSEEEAKMKIYSVTTRYYYTFGAHVSEELSYKLKELKGVYCVLPDSYSDSKNKDYGGEPFIINGQADPTSCRT